MSSSLAQRFGNLGYHFSAPPLLRPNRAWPNFQTLSRILSCGEISSLIFSEVPVCLMSVTINGVRC